MRMYGSQWGRLSAGHSYKKPYILLQVTREYISVRYYKSRAYVWTCNEIEGSSDKIIITRVPSYTEKNITCLLLLALLVVLCTHNNNFALWWYLYGSISHSTMLYYWYTIMLLTCVITANTSILRMATVSSVTIISATDESALSSCATDIIKKNWTSSLTIKGIGMGNSI